MTPKPVAKFSETGESVKLGRWLEVTASRKGTSQTGTRRLSVEDTLRPAFSGDKESVVYLAPEVISTGEFDAARIDIFSLRAIAYHLFFGEPPAGSREELQQKLSLSSRTISALPAPRQARR